MLTRPDRTEAAAYYFTYIDQVPDGDIRETLARQSDDVLDFFRGIPEERSRHRYAPDKWSIREVVGHLSDAERIFVSRALWFARGFPDPLPSFDQNVAVASAGADDRPWASHIEEFGTIRAATLSLFENLPAEAWTRRGIASGNPFSVRGLAWMTAGHTAHHVRILRERYL